MFMSNVRMPNEIEEYFEARVPEGFEETKRINSERTAIQLLNCLTLKKTNPKQISEIYHQRTEQEQESLLENLEELTKQMRLWKAKSVHSISPLQ
jgi:hypothetical protein